MTNGNTGTNDIHDYNHQQQELHQSQQQQQQQHNPVAIIDTGYYADIVQQPVRVRCSEYYNNGTVPYSIEPCIAVQLHRKAQLDILGSSHNTIQNTSLLVARAYLTSSDGCSDRSYFVRPLEIKVQQKVTPDHPLSKPEVMEQHYLSLQQQLNTSQQQQESSSSSSLLPTASLFGSQTTAADIATGEDGSRGVFFFFSDIGIRVPGQFKLRIVISRMPQENCPHSLMNDQTHCTICKHSTQLAEVTTDIFISYPADTWEGHCSQTPLSNHFSRQGIHIPSFKANNKNILKLYKKSKLSE
ncbi:hypothetical protein BASA81_010083 [Batrachochytrium salamandrivorans]|nr:hypothetical protein BASA81_010083 [Batrachochytrium salamandrivorans]